MTMLNDTFEQELALEDDGYNSGSESLSIPTPLHIAPCLYQFQQVTNGLQTCNTSSMLTSMTWQPQHHVLPFDV